MGRFFSFRNQWAVLAVFIALLLFVFQSCTNRVSSLPASSAQNSTGYPTPSPSPAPWGAQNCTGSPAPTATIFHRLINFNNADYVYLFANKIFVATGDGIYISSDGGTCFDHPLIGNGIGGGQDWITSSNGTIYVVTSNGLFTSSDDAKTFYSHPSSPFVSPIWIYGGLFFGETNNGLYASTDGGSTFSLFAANGIPAQGNYFIQDMAVDGGTTYIFFGEGNGAHVFTTTNGGATYTDNMAPGYMNYLYNDLYAGQGTLYLGIGAGLYSSSDGAQTWTTLTTFHSTPPLAVYGLNGEAYASSFNVNSSGGITGQIFFRVSGGQTISYGTTEGFGQSLCSGNIVSDGTNLYVGCNDGVYVTTISLLHQKTQ